MYLDLALNEENNVIRLRSNILTNVEAQVSFFNVRTEKLIILPPWIILTNVYLKYIWI